MMVNFITLVIISSVLNHLNLYWMLSYWNFQYFQSIFNYSSENSSKLFEFYAAVKLLNLQNQFFSRHLINFETLNVVNFYISKSRFIFKSNFTETLSMIQQNFKMIQSSIKFTQFMIFNYFYFILTFIAITKT